MTTKWIPAFGRMTDRQVYLIVWPDFSTAPSAPLEMTERKGEGKDNFRELENWEEIGLREEISNANPAPIKHRLTPNTYGTSVQCRSANARDGMVNLPGSC